MSEQQFPKDTFPASSAADCDTRESSEGSSRITIDAIGLVCPVPIIRLARAAVALTAGSEIELLTDDIAAIHDVPAWCRLRGASYLGCTTAPAGPVTHLIRLGPVPEPSESAVRYDRSTRSEEAT